MSDIDIVDVYGHCEVYINGEFYCSADNFMEAAREVDEYEKQYKINS